MTPPSLIAVGGLPGTGKSVVAQRIAARTNALLLRTDVVRKELFPTPAYTDAETEQIYTAFFGRAAAALAEGRSVVLDATFRRAGLRQRARALADEADAHWQFVLVTAPEHLVRQRLQQRAGDASDADVSVFEQIRQEFEPVEEDFLNIINDGTLIDLDRQIAHHFS